MKTIIKGQELILTSARNIVEQASVLVLLAAQILAMPISRGKGVSLTKIGLTNPTDFLPRTARASLIIATIEPNTGAEAEVPQTYQ